MEIIVYRGTDLDGQAVRTMAASAVSAWEDRDGVHVRFCQSREELARALKEAALGELASTERFFPFKTAQGTRLLRLSQVLYFKSSGHRVVAVLTDGRELTGCTVRVPTSSLLEPLVRTGRFYRIFRSTFVNQMHVRQLGPNWVQLDDGTTMSVSRKYYQAFMQAHKGPSLSKTLHPKDTDGGIV